MIRTNLSGDMVDHFLVSGLPFELLSNYELGSLFYSCWSYLLCLEDYYALKYTTAIECIFYFILVEVS